MSGLMMEALAQGLKDICYLWISPMRE
jgi:hypothetical protein